jgi:hypothetical protein
VKSVNSALVNRAPPRIATVCGSQKINVNNTPPSKSRIIESKDTQRASLMLHKEGPQWLERAIGRSHLCRAERARIRLVCFAELVCQSPSPRDFSSSADGSGRKNPRRSSGVMSLPNNLRKRSKICSWVSVGSRSVTQRSWS